MQDLKLRYLTSEAVTEGHPDKVCDQIADAILDEILRQDPNARVACEVSSTTGIVLVMGEITTKAYVDIATIARNVIRDIGYTDNHSGFNADTCAVLTSINEQSPDIALGVDKSYESKQGELDLTLGAGDQGMIFGYACRETAEYMPLPYVLAQNICRTLSDVRKSGEAKTFQPDGKAQVTVCYDGNTPLYIDTVVVSTQHHADASLEQVQEEVHRLVLDRVLDKDMLRPETKYYINPTGRFVIGGPQGDSGLTGRKIIADTYGGFGHHGGGAFSGKDPTKVDRSAAYAARHAAKNLVAAGLADKLELQLAYAIGVAEPVSLDVETFGTEFFPKAKILELVQKNFDLRPQAIIERFKLRAPIYRATANYGHFGRTDVDLPWERLDMVESLRKQATFD